MSSVKIMKTPFEWIVRAEGGYVNDPNDRGGETNFGISKRSYPSLDIKNLTIDEAIEIYRVDYWDAYRCSELPPAIGLFLFDCLVQHRPKTAIRLLQIAVNAYADGIIGPKTIALANSFEAEKVIDQMFLERDKLYHGLVTANSTQARFLNGWINRLRDLYKFIIRNYLQEK